MRNQFNAERLTLLESAGNQYEESGCKTMTAQEALEVCLERNALRKQAKAERMAMAEENARERKAEHQRVVNRAFLGNGAMRDAFARLSGASWAA